MTTKEKYSPKVFDAAFKASRYRLCLLIFFFVRPREGFLFYFSFFVRDGVLSDVDYIFKACGCHRRRASWVLFNPSADSPCIPS